MYVPRLLLVCIIIYMQEVKCYRLLGIPFFTNLAHPEFFAVNVPRIDIGMKQLFEREQ